MRVFTDAEKQQLQAKIKDEQERQRVLRETAQIKSEKESNRRRGIISTALSYKYVMLGFLLFVFIGDVILLPPQNYSYHNYLRSHNTADGTIQSHCVEFHEKGLARPRDENDCMDLDRICMCLPVLVL